MILVLHSLFEYPIVYTHPSCWSDPLQPDLGKQDSHHFECHLVSRLPQVLLLHCVPLHPRWLHHCHPTCRQWLLPHFDLPPTRHHLQDWGGGCEEGRRNRWTEGKGSSELLYWGWRWGEKVWSWFSHVAAPVIMRAHIRMSVGWAIANLVSVPHAYIHCAYSMIFSSLHYVHLGIYSCSYRCSCVFWDYRPNSNKFISHIET